MRYRVLPYRQGSRGAKALASALGGKVLKLEGSSYIYQQGDVLINWGSTSTGMFTNILNFGFIVNRASNKLKFFQRMRDAGHTDIIPRFWENSVDIPNDAYPICCRTVLAGHSGDGLVLANSPAELVGASLYVQYKKKREEYRVHVGLRNGEARVIAIQRKARRTDAPDTAVNWQVRNHQNGFVYVRGGFTAPQSVSSVAMSALLASGLDFGAVDVIWNEQEQRPYVLEINTAPGLEGQTITDYASFFAGT